MADIVRKATIVLGLETGDVKIEVPDLGPVLKAREKEAELVKKVAGAEEELATAEQKRTKAITATVEKKTRATKGLLDDIEKLDREFEKKFDNFDAGLKKIIDEEKKFVDNTLSSANQFIGATEQMGDGAFLLARSVALLSADSEEDFQAMIKNLVLVQGAFDLFKGSSQIIRGVIANMQALRAASAGVVAVLGPAGIAFAALTAAGAGLAFAFRDSTADIDKNTDSLNRNRNAVDASKSARKQFEKKLRIVAGVDENEFQIANLAKSIHGTSLSLTGGRSVLRADDSNETLNRLGLDRGDLIKQERIIEQKLINDIVSFKSFADPKLERLEKQSEQASVLLEREIDKDAKARGVSDREINTPGELKASEELAKLTRELAEFSRVYSATIQEANDAISVFGAELDAIHAGDISTP